MSDIRSSKSFGNGSKPSRNSASGRKTFQGRRTNSDGAADAGHKTSRSERGSSARKPGGSRPKSDGVAGKARSGAGFGGRSSSFKKTTSTRRNFVDKNTDENTPVKRSGRYLGRKDRGDRNEDRAENIKNIARPGLVPAADEPEIPTDFDENTLPRSIKAELRGLPKDLANKVGAHIYQLGVYFDEDPDLANRHGQAAKRLAARLPVVRQLAAEAAYNAEDYETALTDFRAVYRMSGKADFLPIIADCERGSGNLESGLRTIKKASSMQLSAMQRTELVLVEAGIRKDLGQNDAALLILHKAIQENKGSAESKARLRYAYADFLLATGEKAKAKAWFEAAAKYDTAGQLNAKNRIREIDGEPIVEDTDPADLVYFAEEIAETADDEDPQQLDERQTDSSQSL